MRQSGIAESPCMETERALAGVENVLTAGVDEAGRGPWAGPVVAAAVLFRSGEIPDGLDDSKRLTAERRTELFSQIQETAWVGVGIVSVEEIDRINIFQAAMKAMAQSVGALRTGPEVVLVDGNKAPGLSQRAVTVVNGDRLCPSIAAASIIAKVTRDRMMQELATEFPAYSWHTNKGYGTRAHAEAIASHGVSLHHRRSFTPIQAALANRPIPEASPL